MTVLKTQCPECDAKIRLTVDAVGAHETECPKCGTAFTVETPAAPAAPGKASGAGPAKKSAGVKETAKAGSAAKKTKAARRTEDDEDEDEAPRKKKKKKGGDADAGKKKLVLVGGLAGVLVLGGVVAVVLAVSGKDKPKPTETAASTTSAQAPGPAAPGPVPAPVKPSPPPPTGPTAAGPKPPVVPPKGKEPTDEELATLLPDPPKIRLEGSLVPPPIKPVVKAPVIPPLAPEEDPFVRAKGFVPDGPLPELPKLPDRGVRPVLALDSGGHTAFISKVFFTPDGKRIVTVAEDKAVRLWDPATGETVKTLRFPAGPGKEGSLLAAAMSRSGKRLAVSGEPVQVKGAKPLGKVPVFVVAPDTGATIARIDGASDTVLSLHFSNDGKRLAAGCEDGTIHVFNPDTGASLGKLPTPGSVVEIKFNPLPNTSFIAAVIGGRVLLYDLKTNQSRLFRLEKGLPFVLAWSNDGQYLAVGCTTGEIALFKLDGTPVKALQPVTVAQKVKVPVKTPDGATVGEKEMELKRPVHIWQMQFLPGDRDLAVFGTQMFAAVIDSNTGEQRTVFKRHDNNVFAGDVSADGKRAVSCGGNQNDTYVWEVDGGKPLHRMAGTGAGVWALGWAKDGKSIAWGNQNRREGDARELPLEHTFRLDEFGLGGKPDPSKYTQVVTSDDGVTLELGYQRFRVITPDRDPIVVAPGGGGVIYSATLLPRANAVVAGGVSDIYLVNPATGRMSSNPFVGHTGNVTCVTPSPDGKYFATGSNDQTIRIWRKDVEEPLLTIFVAGREWIAWTPQGYYACSPQGERLMAWQINSVAGVGPAAKAPQVHPAERFRDTLYKPALLKYVVPAGDLPRAMAMAAKFDRDRLELKNIADVFPPEVTLEGFGEVEVKAEKEVLTVRATAKGVKAGVKSMRLLVDGRPFQGKDGIRTFPKAEPGADAAASWDVPLAPGTHTFAVIADTGVSRGMSKVGIAVRPGTPPRPNLYVLAMGVSDYPKGVNPLHYCASDARLLAGAFQKQSKAVFDTIEVKLLTDKACTRQGMIDGLKWLKSKMTPHDVGVVSFSGHGSRDLGGRFYLVPADVDPGDDSNRTCFPGDVLKDMLDGMPGRLVAILDACHSGVASDDGKAPPRADALVRDLAAEDSGVFVMCASLGREYAIESKLTKAGFYTLGLVEGMSGHGDIDGDGVIYLHELDLYATTRVRQLSQGAQNPTFSRPASVQPFPIARPDRPGAP